jgi:hypothetical protein
MKIDLVKPGLAGLAVLFCVLWLTRGCDKPTTKPYNNEFERLKEQSRLDSITNRHATDALLLDRENRRIADSVALRGLKMTVRARDKSLAQARQEIALLMDTIPQVKRYVDAADSTIVARDSVITQLERQIKADEISNVKEVALMGSENVRVRQISQLLETKVTDLTNENGKLERKLTRKKTGNRLLLGIAGGLAAAVTILTLSQ